MSLPTFTGAVLAGGQSRRMGFDKAFIEVGGKQLITCSLDALADASQLLVVGGDDPRLKDAAAAAGAVHVADRWPGEGPLGGVISALSLARHPVAVILPCDLPGVTREDVAALVEAVGAARSEAAPAAAIFTDQRRHFLPMAIDTCAATEAERLFESGKRSVASLLDEAAVVDLPARPSAVADIDSPEDLG